MDYSKVYLSFMDRIRLAYRKKGFFYVLGAFVRNPWIYYVKPFLLSIYWKVKGKPTFIFLGSEHRQFSHWYNSTYQNERAVEIPIARHFLKKFKKGRTLEIGHVLSHYQRQDWDVVDKYEKVSGVLSEDIATWVPAEPYDCVFSISTIEHVGWDENSKKPEMLRDAFENIISNILSFNGIFLFTVPVGWNAYLDEMVKTNSLPAGQYFGLRRDGAGWKECSLEGALRLPYDESIPSARAVIVGIISKK